MQFLGDVVPALPEGDADETAFINAMIAITPPPGSTTLTINSHNNIITRSGNTFSGSFKQADVSTLVSLSNVKSGTGTIVVGSGYEYLYAFYGSGNTLSGFSGDQVALVWDLTGFTGDFTVPTDALSHFELFNPGSGDLPPVVTSVPDGGSTVALLGAALTGIGLLRNKFASRRLV